MELTLEEKAIIYNLLSERYHKLKNKPESRDEKKFQGIENLFISFGADMQKEYGRDWYIKLR